MSDRVLIVVHQKHSTPGRVGEMLAARGLRLDRRVPNLGDPLPRSLVGYAGAIVFGGPMSANDDHLAGIRAELDWLPDAIESNKPVVGICLGAQLMARALGGQVGPHPDGLVEIGYYDVSPTNDGAEMFDGPATFYQWHSETFEIPPGAVHLAESESFRAQAFRYGERAFGLEFHPEMTLEMIERWTCSEGGAPKLTLPGAQPREAHLDGYHRHGEGSDRWLARFLDRLFLER